MTTYLSRGGRRAAAAGMQSSGCECWLKSCSCRGWFLEPAIASIGRRSSDVVSAHTRTLFRTPLLPSTPIFWYILSLLSSNLIS